MDPQAQNPSAILVSKTVLPPYVPSVLEAYHGSPFLLSSLQENSLGMDGVIYVATALSENHGLHHIK